MNVYVINLARRPERMRYIAGQLDKAGVAYERIEAVDGARLSDAERMSAANGFLWWCAKGYRPRAGEIGCGLSHREAWRRVIEGDMAQACVLEDDVALSCAFPDVVGEAESFLDDDECARAVIFTPKVSDTDSEGRGVCFQRIQWAMSTGGYAINRKAAERLLEVTLPLASTIDDWCRWARRGGIELYASCPAVCSQAEYGSEPWDSPFASDTRERGFVFAKDMSIPRRVCHSALRVVGKLIDKMVS